MNKLVDGSSKTTALDLSNFERKGIYHCPFCFQLEELELKMIEHRDTSEECATARSNIRANGKAR